MKVLIACEESQRVCNAFRDKGHEAFSCDILNCSGGHPEWHIQADVLRLLNPRYYSAYDAFMIIFQTLDGKEHCVYPKWDLIIAHPPCTHLCSAGQRWFSEGRKPISLRDQAISFFYRFVFAHCDKIAIENPVGVMSTFYRKPDQIYNPYDFEGESECKRTCLWLKGLNPLKPTQILPIEDRTHGIFNACFGGHQYSWSDSRVAGLRSKTPIGVARAMADQWGSF